MTQTQEPRPHALVSLACEVRGDVLLPHDDDYEAARLVWNATVDARPAVIVRAEDASDVAATIRFAKDPERPPFPGEQPRRT